MAQFKRLAPLKRIIKKNFSGEMADRFLKGIDVSYSDSTTLGNTVNIYQDALKLLLNGDMEKAINYIIFGLDIDRDNKLLFSLCKNMTYLLSKFMVENNAEFYKQKYASTLRDAKTIIQEKLLELRNSISDDKKKLKKLEKALNDSKPKFFTITKLYTIYLWKKKKSKIPIAILQKNLLSYPNKIEKLQIDLEEIEKLIQSEDYIKVLGQVIEVCIFPTRFEWALLPIKNTETKSAEGQLRN